MTDLAKGEFHERSKEANQSRSSVPVSELESKEAESPDELKWNTNETVKPEQQPKP
jgi:hypothetical protein